MADEAASLQDQIDQLEGNTVGIENRRHEKALADIKEEATASGTLNSEAYRKLVDLENKLHALKLKNAKEEQTAQGNNGGSVDGGSAGGRPGGGRGGGGVPNPKQTVEHTITINGHNFNIDDLDPNAIQQLTQAIIEEIRQAGASSM